jgi:hypothetical protein
VLAPARRIRAVQRALAAAVIRDTKFCIPRQQQRILPVDPSATAIARRTSMDLIRQLTVCRRLLALGLGLWLASASVDAAAAAADLPDPGKLITVAELEAIVGKIKAGPKPVDATLEGAVASEFTLASNDDWVTLTLYPADRADFDDAIRRLRGPGTVPLPELGKDAFVNPSSADVAADLYVRKGSILLEVSIAKGDGAVEKLKAIAKIALARLP